MLILLQTNVGNEYQGRIFGALSAIQAIAMLIGISMAGVLGDRIGIVPMLLVDAGFNMLVAFLAFMLIRVSLQSAQPPAGTNELGAQEAATL